MALTSNLVKQLQTQRPSAREVKKGTGFSDVMVDDYLTIFENILLLASNMIIADAVDGANASSVDVVKPSPPPAYAFYSPIDTQIMVDLINEQKASINQLTTDLNAVVTQLNEVIINLKAAKQMAS